MTMRQSSETITVTLGTDPVVVAREAFLRYEKLRASGKINMWMPEVQRLARISRDTHRAIIHAYAVMAALWLPERQA